MFTEVDATRQGRDYRKLINMIYIIRMNGSDYYKIGYTGHKDATKRMAQLQTSCPLKLILVAEMEGNEIKESELHRKFYEYRTDGGEEWFKIPEEKIKEILNEQPKHENSSYTGGPTAFDVRPIRRGYANQTSTRGQDVSGREQLLDSSGPKHLFITGGRKHQKRLPSVLRKERKDDRPGD